MKKKIPIMFLSELLVLKWLVYVITKLKLITSVAQIIKFKDGGVQMANG